MPGGSGGAARRHGPAKALPFARVGVKAMPAAPVRVSVMPFGAGRDTVSFPATAAGGSAVRGGRGSGSAVVHRGGAVRSGSSVGDARRWRERGALGPGLRRCAELRPPGRPFRSRFRPWGRPRCRLRRSAARVPLTRSTKVSGPTPCGRVPPTVPAIVPVSRCGPVPAPGQRLPARAVRGRSAARAMETE